LLAAALLKPQLGIGLVLFVTWWAIFSGRRQLVGWLATGVALMAGLSLLLDPGWPMQMIRQVFDYLGLAVILSPVARVSESLGLGQAGTLAISAFLLAYLFWEWKESLGGEERRFLWTAAITQAIFLLIVPFGIVSAIYRNSAADFAVRLTAVLGLAIPSFWLATLVIMVPSELWRYAPPLGRSISFFDDPSGNLRQFGPPAAVLALASAAGIMRLTRSSLLEVMRSDYVRTARSKGLREPVVIGRHALKNSIIPVVTVLGLQVSAELGGSVIIEQIFALPGLGQYTFQALFAKEYPVVQTMTLYVGAVVVLMNLLVDVSYAWLDPRIRYS